MAVLAGIGKLGFDLVDASRVLGFLALVATFFAVYRIWKLWCDEEEGSGLESPLLLAAVLLGLALTDAIAFWGFSGMETPLFMALLTGGAYLYLRERRSVGFPWSAMAFTAAAMTRPEGLIAVAVTGGFVLAEVVQATDRQRVVRRASVWGGLFLLL
jgi:apolipoprotein N-acyltransferase